MPTEDIKCVTGTDMKKRMSSGVLPAPSASPVTEPKSKRPKLAMATTSNREEVLDRYRTGHEMPLLSDEEGIRNHPRRLIRAASVVSPSKAPSTFPPRAKSVPLQSVDVVPSLDLIASPPSPRRSPSKMGIEIRCAPFQPPRVEGAVEVDNVALSSSDSAQFVKVVSSPAQKPPTFNYTVNFATPISHSRWADPLSPLTPLPPTPSTRQLQRIPNSATQVSGKI